MASKIIICSLPESADDFYEALSCEDFSRKFVAEYDLKRALNRLTTRERKIMRLIYWHNLTQAQVANSVGLSRQWIIKLHSRAILKLKNTLHGYE